MEYWVIIVGILIYGYWLEDKITGMANEIREIRETTERIESLISNND